MNAEDCKKWEEIKSVYGVGTVGEWPNIAWLIARLQAEAQENERLRQELRDRRGDEMDRLENLTIRAETAEARIAELEALFALQQTRMTEATRAWQEATGKRDVLPDLGDLLAWLMDRPAELEAQVRKLRDALEGMIEQFSYDDCNGKFCTGGLWALEDAFAALGWDEKHPMPEGMICDEPGCEKRVTCGTPTPKGYRSVCGEHYRILAESQEGKEEPK
jgi:hypothetical protein